MKALYLCDNVGAHLSNENEIETSTKVSASGDWAVEFVRRHGLQSIALNKEAGGADSATVTEGSKDIRDKLNEYGLSNFNNDDEEKLFFKLFPRRMYVRNTEDNNCTRSVKVMSTKNYDTEYICTNTNGLDKLPLEIIEKPKNLRCIKSEQTSIPYFSQKNIWSEMCADHK